MGLHAATWSGRTFTYVVVTIGLAANALGRELSPTTATDRQLAVLVDVLEGSVPVGLPELVRSTLVDLRYLDGRDARHFEKVDERVGYRGERVVTWRIHGEA